MRHPQSARKKASQSPGRGRLPAQIAADTASEESKQVEYSAAVSAVVIESDRLTSEAIAGWMAVNEQKNQSFAGFFTDLKENAPAQGQREDADRFDRSQLELAIICVQKADEGKYSFKDDSIHVLLDAVKAVYANPHSQEEINVSASTLRTARPEARRIPDKEALDTLN